MEEKVSYLKDNSKKNNLQIIVRERKIYEKKKGKGDKQVLEEIITENFPTLWMETASRSKMSKQDRLKQKNPNHIVVKKSKISRETS